MAPEHNICKNHRIGNFGARYRCNNGVPIRGPERSPYKRLGFLSVFTIIIRPQEALRSTDYRAQIIITLIILTILRLQLHSPIRCLWYTLERIVQNLLGHAATAEKKGTVFIKRDAHIRWTESLVSMPVVDTAKPIRRGLTNVLRPGVVAEALTRLLCGQEFQWKF